MTSDKDKQLLLNKHVCNIETHFYYIKG